MRMAFQLRWSGASDRGEGGTPALPPTLERFLADGASLRFPWLFVTEAGPSFALGSCPPNSSCRGSRVGVAARCAGLVRAGLLRESGMSSSRIERLTFEFALPLTLPRCFDLLRFLPDLCRRDSRSREDSSELMDDSSSSEMDRVDDLRTSCLTGDGLAGFGFEGACFGGDGEGFVPGAVQALSSIRRCETTKRGRSDELPVATPFAPPPRFFLGGEARFVGRGMVHAPIACAVQTDPATAAQRGPRGFMALDCYGTLNRESTKPGSAFSCLRPTQAVPFSCLRSHTRF